MAPSGAGAFGSGLLNPTVLVYRASVKPAENSAVKLSVMAISAWMSAPLAMAVPRLSMKEMAHTGGTTVHGFPGYASNEPVPTLVQVLNGEKPANTPPICSEAAPGARWNYSGGGFTMQAP